MCFNYTRLSRPLLLATSLLLACKKDAPDADAPAIRLFTGGTELTDAAVRLRFQARYAATFAPLVAGSADKLTFSPAADTARFAPATMPFTVVKSGSQYLFYSPLVVQLSDDNLLLYKMLKYVAPKVPVPCASGSLGGCYLTREVRVGIGESQQVRVSYLQYCWLQGRYGVQRGRLLNELNEHVVTDVAPGDTLAVRVGSISLPMQ